MSSLSNYPVLSGTRCSYGEVRFNAACKTELTLTPKYDESNRNVIAILAQLSVEGFIGPGDYTGTGNTVANDCLLLKRLLCKDGQRLRYEGLGAGDYDIGPGGAVRDLNWGPKPELLTFVPLGGGIAARFVWRVKWEMSVCPNGVGSVYSHVHEIDYDIDGGLTTRTVRGVIAIPMQRNGPNDRTIPANVDDTLEQVMPPLIAGYERKSSRSISNDRRMLRYSFVDRQIGGQNAFPAGVIDIECKHGISSFASQPGVLLRWIWRISGSVTVAQHVESKYGMTVAMSILKSRLDKFAREYALPINQFVMGDKDSDVFALPAAFSMSESLFKRKTTDFDMSFMLILKNLEENEASRTEFLTKSGMYDQLLTGWDDWTNSMLIPFDARGIDRRRHDVSKEKLEDVCDAEVNFQGEDWEDAFPEQEVDVEIIGDDEAEGMPLYYQTWIETDSGQGNVFHVPYDPTCNLQVQNVSPPINEYYFCGMTVMVKTIYEVPKIASIQGDQVMQSGNATTLSWDAGIMPVTGLPLVVTEWRVPYRGVRRLESDGTTTDATMFPPKPPSLQDDNGQGLVFV